MLFVLAVLVTGYSRVWLAAVLTFVVGVSWELVQTTIVGHNPRVVDLFPNVVGIAIAWIIVFVSVFLWRCARSHDEMRPDSRVSRTGRQCREAQNPPEFPDSVGSAEP